MTEINRTDLINNLAEFEAFRGNRTPDEHGHLKYIGSRGDFAIAAGLAKHFDTLTGYEDVSLFGQWRGDLSRNVVEAMHAIGTQPVFEHIRSKYQKDTEREFPSDLLDISEGVSHRLTAMSVSRLISVLSYPAAKRGDSCTLREELFRYFTAQQTVVDHAWQRFVRVGYPGMIRRIKDETHRGNKGTFGGTQLMTWACAGRVMFIFNRSNTNLNVTYVADDSDMRGLRSESNSTHASYLDCIQMIDEVVGLWDIDKMQRDDKVGVMF